MSVIEKHEIEVHVQKLLNRLQKINNTIKSKKTYDVKMN